jgi:hypothetical protein
MSDLFKEIIPSILQTKKVEVTQENERDYVPFVVNKALSFHKDCVLFANEMNKVPNIDGILQYHYHLHSIRAYKRPFQKWQKLVKDADLLAVKEYFNYSNERAKEAMTVLSPDDLVKIKKSLFKGGSKK